MTIASSGAIPASTAFRTIPFTWPSSAMSSGSRSSVQNAIRFGPSSCDERQEVEQVPRHRGLADEEPHAGAEPLAPLLDRQRLVVGLDARRGVRLQLLPEDARGVAVDVLGALERELLELGRRTRDDAGEVHHLREPEHAPPPHAATRGRPGRAGAAATRTATRARTTTP